MRTLVLLLIIATQVYAKESASQSAKTNYMINCQGCHQSDGSGMPGLVPNMKDYLSNFLRVPGGREFLVRVPGSANAPLDNKALADTLNWMLFAFSKDQMPETFKPFSAEEVGRLRMKGALINVDSLRAGLVEYIERNQGSP